MKLNYKNLITYNNSVYHINEKFNSLERKNLDSKTKPSTGAKIMFSSLLCGHKSINELIQTNINKDTNLKGIFSKREFIPKMHGLRDCIKDTNYLQIKKINDSIINKAKENKVFRKNKVDGLVVVAWDGVELTETTKDINGLPEREYEDGLRKYIKYTVAMNVSEKANIIIDSRQLLEKEKVITESGRKRAKTTSETKQFEEMFHDVNKKMGTVDVHVMDALYLNKNVMNLVNNNNEFFVIRMTDETRIIYQDAKELFDRIKPIKEYEIVEIITRKKIKYFKQAKKKDCEKTKIKLEVRKISNEKLGKKRLIETKIQHKKNSVIYITVHERIKTRKKVWAETFDMTGYKDPVRVIKSLETKCKKNKETISEIYLATNMHNHDYETILKIIHLRWNIENSGFRTLKQRFNLEHIFIGDINSINYIVQMVFMVFNLLELYMKVRLKKVIKETWAVITKCFGIQMHNDNSLYLLFESC